jgi:hypothetical protein
VTGLQQSDRDELQLLYQVTTTDIAYFKTQQWAVTYYCLLVDAALVGIAQLLHPNLGSPERILLSALAILAAVSALVILKKLEYALSVRHKRLGQIRDLFGTIFRGAWEAGEKREEYIHSLYILYGGVVLTTLITLWLVASRL